MWAKWLHHPCRLGGPHCPVRGQKSEMSTWTTCGQSGYVTPAVLGVSDAQRGEKNVKWLHAPQVGEGATSALPSWGSPTRSARTKISNGDVAHMRARWLHHPCRLGGPQRPMRGHHPAVLGVPNAQRGDKNLKWLRGPQVGKVATSPLPAWGSNAQSGDKSNKWRCGPHVGKVATSPLLSWGPPTPSVGTKIRNCYVAHMWAKCLHHPCRLGGRVLVLYGTVQSRKVP